MDDADARGDRLAKIVIIGSRSAMKGQGYSGSCPDDSDPLNIQVLFRFATHHACGHAMHVPNGWSENIDTCLHDKLSRLFRSCQPFGWGRHCLMDFGATPDIADLSLHQH